MVEKVESGVAPAPPPLFYEHRNVSRPSSSWIYLKPCFDAVFSASALVVAAPVFLLIAMAIKIESRGPVFFRQPRFGRDCKVILVTKFRTMHQASVDVGGRQQAVRNDPRVTRLGRILRRTCLDEIPQLWDVLCGRLSIVGPRPHPIEMEIEGVRADIAIDNYHRRHALRPGITGLAQISGNSGPVETLEKGRDRISKDIQYIDSLSFWLDMRIIFATFGAVIFRGSSY